MDMNSIRGRSSSNIQNNKRVGFLNLFEKDHTGVFFLAEKRAKSATAPSKDKKAGAAPPGKLERGKVSTHPCDTTE